MAHVIQHTSKQQKMKAYLDDDDDLTDRTDFFDPFWMLFSDEDDQSEATGRMNPIRRRKDDAHGERESSGMFDYFMAETEEREPRQPNRWSPKSNQEQQLSRQKKQHSYWRRNQPKKEKERRLSFGRKSNSKRKNRTPPKNCANKNSSKRHNKRPKND